MGDVPEVQITPETPGRPEILNPFESPNDYHRLHESVVASPSVFKSSKALSATPAKFKWSIDEMASLLPVEIDAEDIHRQSLYLRQTRTDKEIEEKRQYAIEQFFTKGEIVPSPWAESTNKQSTQMHAVKSSISPGIPEEEIPTRKCSVASQTTLSIPADLDLEKVLGEYYKPDDASDPIQESLSSSSLRRKLFLDGIGSGSESSTPSSPDQGPQEAGGPRGGGVPRPVSVSPLQCGGVLTPTPGQFSSSPIQSRCRAYSLGSVSSPKFPEMTSPEFRSPMLSPMLSPTLSPIVLQYGETPVSGEKLNFVTPDGVTPSSSDADNCARSPYVEGCSPIKSCSPVAPRSRIRAAAPHRRGSPGRRGAPVAMEPCASVSMEPCAPVPMEACAPDPEPMEDVGGPREDWGQDEVAPPTGRMSNMESTGVFPSLLAEGSSMQVDSGYSTCLAGAMDGAVLDGLTKESLNPQGPDEAFLYTKTQHLKSKMLNLHHW